MILDAGMKNITGNGTTSFERRKDSTVATPPQILYKYLDVDGAIKTLENCTLKFSSPLSLNDPFECLYGGEPEGYRDLLLKTLYAAKDSECEWNRVCRERLGLKYQELVSAARRDLDKPGDFEKKIDEFLEEFGQQQAKCHKQTLRKFAISSFSELPDSILMWGHYADKHKGCVIGVYSNAFGEWYKVRYSSERVCRPMTKEDVRRIAMDSMRTKSTDWEYEHEWRLICPVDKLDTRDGVLVMSIPPETIHTIILGIRADGRLEDVVRTFARKHPNCTVFRAIEHPSEYNIDTYHLEKKVHND